LRRSLSAVALAGAAVAEGGTIEPDIGVGWRFADFRCGVDTVLERARE
jgi:hypothetical protein